MVEVIPGDDLVSRLVDSPHKWSRAERRFCEPNLFEFPSEKPESVIWRKYAPEVAGLHAMGCAMQATKRAAKPDWTYEGAVSAKASEIRSIRNKAAHSFFVEHAPAEGLHHAHVGYLLLAGSESRRHRTARLTCGSSYATTQHLSCRWI
jgi:hypothetical protein